MIPQSSSNLFSHVIYLAGFVPFSPTHPVAPFYFSKIPDAFRCLDGFSHYPSWSYSPSSRLFFTTENFCQCGHTNVPCVLKIFYTILTLTDQAKQGTVSTCPASEYPHQNFPIEGKPPSPEAPMWKYDLFFRASSISVFKINRNHRHPASFFQKLYKHDVFLSISSRHLLTKRNFPGSDNLTKLKLPYKVKSMPPAPSVPLITRII